MKLDSIAIADSPALVCLKFWYEWLLDILAENIYFGYDWDCLSSCSRATEELEVAISSSFFRLLDLGTVASEIWAQQSN